jgi:hypothetical protein
MYTAALACEPECGCTLAYSASNSFCARSMASDSILSMTSPVPP